MWPFGSFLRSQHGILCFNWQVGLATTLVQQCCQSQRTMQRIIETVGDNDALLFEGLNVNDEIQKVLSKYEELKTPIAGSSLYSNLAFDSSLSLSPDSPIHAKEDALIRKPASQQGGTAGGSNDDLMDDLDEMIFGKKGGSASKGAQDPKKDQLSKDYLVTF
ncbi:TOM1-LIKE PROTEIN 1 [Salix purpurea]|uniref:TOM1-LIKE PROTEIN 1 n=1 Tax=Salix purpurea TaxID=77065 RepID=A0A9Q0WAT8_SALPP|nr:TOM1-LIKE PROTEIN 1 [Salix purpurea]